ncbi:hypothetical protein TBLA_0B04100 [Henningerozyma blattae CBS 6284]|uniref:dynamin GTPase n=1 Tax=Henningerozyma blattae (strain ATCC 34711 / CBS 6284 / DSM 70876 / NBRC 10599 / NRRL Y-10934 / UCD 77-7) TaxID=1071380 RepID=I2GYP6_HENB6|nr:hypothetical protein TBLA_0B04100 [Tetrapisispora blattae CBS 6284]CCH59248.1 hypothetical protein TBLA_0B04100 [Tetrapisispora blattae CBS 6284]
MNMVSSRNILVKKSSNSFNVLLNWNNQMSIRHFSKLLRFKTLSRSYSYIDNHNCSNSLLLIKKNVIVSKNFNHNLSIISQQRFISLSFIPKLIVKTVKFPAYIAGGAAGVGSYMAYKLEEVNNFAKDKLDTMKDITDYLKDTYNNSTMFKKDSHSGNNNNNNNTNGSDTGLGTAVLLTTLADEDKSYEGDVEEEEDDDEEEDEDDEYSSDQTQDEMLNLTKQMIEIRTILNKINSTTSQQLTLPSIVVIGSQSSGKSSVLESIVGKEFLPKGSNMVTRRPIELTLVNTPNANEITADFPAMRKYNIKNFNEVSKLLLELNMSVPSSEAISEDPIELTIKSPNVPDLSLVDLPGYIQIEAADQPYELKSKIAKLCDRYLQEPNIILAISAADVDLANSSALRASKLADPKGLRTIGVITKLDLVDPSVARNILNNKKYPLKMGYVGVITKSPPKQTTASSIMKSRSLFASSSSTTTSSSMLGNSQSNKNSVSSERQNLTRQFEKKFFNDHKSEFKNCQISTKVLRKKLIKILEISMSNALEPTSDLIQQELDDTSYLFKVEYNDRQLTPKSYLLNNIDILKLTIKEFQEKFNRNEMKSILRANLDQKVLDFLATRYWKDGQIYELSKESNTTKNPQINNSSNTTDSDMLYWHRKLELASSSLTKIGVGRLSTVLITNSILKELNNILDLTKLKNHDLIKELVNNTAIEILNSKYYTTADQVENCIKPFKYEVDLEDRDWDIAHERSIKLINEELRQCNDRFEKIRNTIGGRKLKQVMSYIESNNIDSNNNATIPEETLGMSKLLIERGSEALFLKKRKDVLDFRLKLLKIKCNSTSEKDQCPEVFLNAVSDKLTSTAVLFLNVELLSDFFYNFPIELDKKLNALTDEQIEMFAKQDIKIAKHIELQQRKELLELALDKMDSILLYKKSYKNVNNK